MKPVVYILGPTASGKTGLSVELASAFDGEILSGDSMQIYTGMHVASAAPDPAETKDVPHHLFEFLSPTESFSVSRYVELADAVIGQIHARGRLPFVVGGTGLYLSALSEHIAFGADPADDGYRKALYEKAERVGLCEMYRYLCEIDPAAGEKISPNDQKRILRAIEVFETSGMTKSQRDAVSKQSGPIYRNLLIGLTYRDRELLYDRINRRVELMLKNGLLEEAKAAFGAVSGTAAQAIGHKELFPYFAGEKPLEETVEHLKMQTRRYAKRQMTWFKKMADVNWIYMDEEKDPISAAKELVKRFLTQ